VQIFRNQPCNLYVTNQGNTRRRGCHLRKGSNPARAVPLESRSSGTRRIRIERRILERFQHRAACGRLARYPCFGNHTGHTSGLSKPSVRMDPRSQSVRKNARRYPLVRPRSYNARAARRSSRRHRKGAEVHADALRGAEIYVGLHASAGFMWTACNDQRGSYARWAIAATSIARSARRSVEKRTVRTRVAGKVDGELCPPTNAESHPRVRGSGRMVRVRAEKCCAGVKRSVDGHCSNPPPIELMTRRMPVDPYQGPLPKGVPPADRTLR